MDILGVLGLGKNPGACLLRGGQLVACAEEERFNREKLSMGRWPVGAVRYCLEAGDLSLDEVDRVAIAWGLQKYPAEMQDFFTGLESTYPKKGVAFRATERGILERLSPESYISGLTNALSAARLGRLDRDRVDYFDHHACHAAMSYHSSGFGEALVFVIDGSGEDEATTVWRGRDGELAKLEQFKLPHSLGRAYATMTEYLGFRAYTDEGKVMGLAPYGEHDPEIVAKLSRLLSVAEDGTYVVDPDFIHYGAHTHNPRFTDELVDLLGAPRVPKQRNEPIDQRYKNVAFAIQHLLEKAVTGLVRRHVADTGVRRVALCGGVAMNCKMNGLVARMPEVEDLFVHPASHDGGAPIGAAMLCARGQEPELGFRALDDAYYGPSYSDEYIENLLDYAKLPFEKHDSPAEVVATALAEGQVVALFQGRMEMGARALGNRSILANPLLPDTKALLNDQIKHREDWRPFCPSILAEDAERYFGKVPNPWYMLVAVAVDEDKAGEIPSAVHVDGTARPQFVTRDSNPLFWEIISRFRDRTGVPVVINTSFNVMGEPVINKPEEAVRCFYSTGIDMLVMQRYVLRKPQRDGG